MRLFNDKSKSMLCQLVDSAEEVLVFVRHGYGKSRESIVSTQHTQQYIMKKENCREATFTPDRLVVPQMFCGPRKGTSSRRVRNEKIPMWYGSTNALYTDIYTEDALSRAYDTLSKNTTESIFVNSGEWKRWTGRRWRKGSGTKYSCTWAIIWLPGWW